MQIPGIFHPYYYWGTRSRQGRRANVQDNDLEIDKGLARLT